MIPPIHRIGKRFRIAPGVCHRAGSNVRGLCDHVEILTANASRERNESGFPLMRGVGKEEEDMNFTIGWVLAIAAAVLAIIAIIFWASASGARRQ